MSEGTGRISTRTAALIAWSLWLLVVIFFVVSFAVSFDLTEWRWYWYKLTHPRLWSAEDIGGIFIWNILPPAALLAYTTVGAVVVSLRPKNRIGWLCLVPGLLAFFLEGIARQLADRLHVTFLMDWQSRLTYASAIVALLSVTLVLLIFPTGRLPSRRWRFAVWTALGSTGLVVLVDSLSAIHASVRVAETVGLLASFSAFVTSVATVVLRWRRGRGQERQQLKWLAYTVTVTTAAGLGAVASWYIQKDIPGAESYPTVLIFVIAVAGVTVGIPVAVGVAILKHRLYDIDRLINRTLVYVTLTAFLALLYLGGVATAQTIFRFLTGQDQQPQIAVVASTLVIAALFNPLRRRIQAFIDRRFYRRKYDAAKTLEAFSAKLRDKTDLEALSSEVVEVIKETMQPAHASLWLRPDTSPDSERPD